MDNQTPCLCQRLRTFAEKAATANAQMVKAHNVMWEIEEALDGDAELRGVVRALQYSLWGDLLLRLPLAPGGALPVPDVTPIDPSAPIPRDDARWWGRMAATAPDSPA